MLWHLEELGARMWLLSFSIAVAALVSLPVAVVAEPIVRQLGCGRLVAVGLAAVGVKLFGENRLRRSLGERPRGVGWCVRSHSHARDRMTRADVYM